MFMYDVPYILPFYVSYRCNIAFQRFFESWFMICVICSLWCESDVSYALYLVWLKKSCRITRKFPSNSSSTMCQIPLTHRAEAPTVEHLVSLILLSFYDNFLVRTCHSLALTELLTKRKRHILELTALSSCGIHVFTCPRTLIVNCFIC